MIVEVVASPMSVYVAFVIVVARAVIVVENRIFK